MTALAFVACVVCVCGAIGTYARVRGRMSSMTMIRGVVESFDSAPGAGTKGMASGMSAFRRYRLRLPDGDTADVFGYGAYKVGDAVEIARDARGTCALRPDLFRSVIWWTIAAAASAAIAIAAYFNLP